MFSSVYVITSTNRAGVVKQLFINFTMYDYITVLLSFGQSHWWHKHLDKIYRHFLDRMEDAICFLYKLYSVHPCMMPTVNFCTISKLIPTHRPCILYTLLLTVKPSTNQLSFGFWPGNKPALADYFLKGYLASLQTNIG